MAINWGKYLRLIYGNKITLNYGGPQGTVTELLFEKKGLITEILHLILKSDG